jgi:hypothetical protein
VSASLELRWFSPGLVPPHVNEWFQIMDDKNLVIFEEPREDFQMYIPTCDYLGVKLRDGRLEIKWRRGEGKYFESHHGRCCGMVENWIKWSWIPPAEGQGKTLNSSSYRSFLEQVPVGPSIKIRKKRTARKYKISQDRAGNDGNGDKDENDLPITLQPLKRVPDKTAGCSLEITEISALDKDYWTLGFETFGVEKTNFLKMAAARLLSAYVGPHLKKGNSYGYPYWLRTLSVR